MALGLASTLSQCVCLSTRLEPTSGVRGPALEQAVLPLQRPGLETSMFSIYLLLPVQPLSALHPRERLVSPLKSPAAMLTRLSGAVNLMYSESVSPTGASVSDSAPPRGWRRRSWPKYIKGRWREVVAPWKTSRRVETQDRRILEDSRVNLATDRAPKTVPVCDSQFCCNGRPFRLVSSCVLPSGFPENRCVGSGRAKERA